MSSKEEEVEAKVVTTDETSRDKEGDKDDDVPQTFPQRVSVKTNHFVIHRVSFVLRKLSSHHQTLSTMEPTAHGNLK